MLLKYKKMSQEDWWTTEYASDIVESMRHREQKIGSFCAQSPQLAERRMLIDWIADIEESFKLQNTTIHLAVYLLDYFMDNHNIDNGPLKLVGLGCVLVAAKFEEKDSKVPRISELNKLASNLYDRHEFQQMELMLMDFFDWNLMVPTAAHFIGFYLQDAVAPTDYCTGQPIQSFKTVQEEVRHFVKYFLDKSLQDHFFLRFPRSLVASACIASARLYLVISPQWSTSLQKLTRYTLDQLQACVEVMLRALEADEEAASKLNSKTEKLYSEHVGGMCSKPSSPSSKNSPSPSSSVEFER